MNRSLAQAAERGQSGAELLVRAKNAPREKSACNVVFRAGRKCNAPTRGVFAPKWEVDGVGPRRRVWPRSPAVLAEASENGAVALIQAVAKLGLTYRAHGVMVRGQKSVAGGSSREPTLAGALMHRARLS